MDPHTLIGHIVEAERKQVVELDLRHQQIGSLPQALWGLQSLKVLRLDRNNLKSIPSEIGKLTNLKRLTISGNQLQSIPVEISLLTSLEELDLHKNALATIPAECRALTHLRELDLSGNSLTSLPSEMGQCTRLEKLWLDSNQLSEIPSTVANLTNLRTLELGQNPLTTIPGSIGELKELLVLGLIANGIREVPLWLTRLTKLEMLGLNYNPISKLPSEIGRLENLRHLRLDNCGLNALPPDIGALRNLTYLALNDNALQVLPRELGNLVNLTDLILSNNRLVSLPGDIGGLSALKELDLRNNALTELPYELGQLSHAVNVRLTDNPLVEPLPELLKRGTAAILTYLRSVKDSIAQYEAKVLLVGEGNVGKTSLVAALRGEPFVENRITTHGIGLGTLHFQHPRRPAEMVLHDWDFGGQEVYRTTHQFFYTNRSLYLIVWKPREGQTENAVEEWLKRIALRVSKDISALVVATHCDGDRHPELDYAFLKKKYGAMLVGNFEIDNKLLIGIPSLRTAIAEASSRLPQMGERISKRWISARSSIIATEAPEIPYATFAGKCAQHKMDEDEITTFINLLHDIGHLVHYEDDGLKDVVVLQPEWITKAIGYVLEDGVTRKAHGVLDHARLREIWSSKGQQNRESYAPEYHPYFLRLMEKYDICYRIPDSEKSLVAQLVPFERPNLPWEIGRDIPEQQRELVLSCRMPEAPPGLVPWLNVRNHRFSKRSLHWRRGVFLEHQMHEALIELTQSDELLIAVRGHSPYHFMSLLRDSLEHLIDLRWPGLDYELSIPCPRMVSEAGRCTGRFPFHFLRKAQERGLQMVTCQSCVEVFHIDELLFGFAPSPTPLQQQLDSLGQRINVIKRDVGTLNEFSVHSAEQMRRMIKAISGEINDCPRLFCLVAPRHSPWYSSAPRVTTDYKLTLVCEHPGHEHLCKEATYTFKASKEWAAAIAPYASLVAKALRVTVPLVRAGLGLIVEETNIHEIQPQLAFMDKLASTFLTGELDLHEKGGLEQSLLTKAEGAGLRELRSFLMEKDRRGNWGGLRRVLTQAGDYLWVCPKHYQAYDPGLPKLPEVST